MNVGLDPCLFRHQSIVANSLFSRPDTHHYEHRIARRQTAPTRADAAAGDRYDAPQMPLDMTAKQYTTS